MAPEADDIPVHRRWSRTHESGDFFIDEDRLRLYFRLILLGCASALALLAAGLWRLSAAASAPPDVWGMANGLIFRGRPEDPAAVRSADLDRQLSDTVEVLFGRTEKGLPPQIGDFCSADVVARVNLACRDTDERLRDGFVQTFVALGSKAVAAAPGYRQVYYRGLLTSRSPGSAQTSSIYLDCAFSLRKPEGLNATGWRLVRATAISRADYYRDEREKAVRQLLDPESSHG
jgi:hypothetical protein